MRGCARDVRERTSYKPGACADAVAGYETC
jgi:hypothetical protein